MTHRYVAFFVVTVALSAGCTSSIVTDSPNSDEVFRLEYATSSSLDPLLPLDGATISTTIWVRLTVVTSLAVDHVEWLIDNTLFRNDEVDAPYDLTNMPSGWGLSEWGAGSTHTVTGRVFLPAGETRDVNAAVTITTVVPEICKPATCGTAEGFPNGSNTGWVGAGVQESDLTSSGWISVETAGAVIDRLDIAGRIEIWADNVTIKRSRIRSADYWPIRIFDDHTGLVVEDVEIIGTSSCEAAITAGAYVARRLNVHDCTDGLRTGTGTTIEDSYIHDLIVANDSHNDGIQHTDGSGAVIRHNTICLPNGANSAVIIQTDFGVVDDVVVENNVMDGGGYTVFSRIGNWGTDNGNVAPTNVKFLNNRFGHSYAFGLFSFDGSVEVSGNVWVDTCEPVPAP